MAHMKKLQKDDTERLREEFDALRDDFTALVRDLKAYAGHGEQAMEERANERVVALKRAGAHQFDLARRYAADAGRAAETTVREHPGYAIAGAAALGFLLGAVIRRRH